MLPDLFCVFSYFILRYVMAVSFLHQMAVTVHYISYNMQLCIDSNITICNGWDIIINKLGQSWAKLNTGLVEIVDWVGRMDQFDLVDLVNLVCKLHTENQPSSLLNIEKAKMNPLRFESGRQTQYISKFFLSLFLLVGLKTS